MSRMIIHIDETRRDGMVGIGVNFTYEDLEVGDVLPGLCPSIIRTIRQLISMHLGDIVLNDEEIEKLKELIN